MKIALKEVSFTDLVCCIGRSKFTLKGGNWKNCSLQLTIMGQLLKTDYSKFKISVADYFFSIFANCLEKT